MKSFLPIALCLVAIASSCSMSGKAKAEYGRKAQKDFERLFYDGHDGNAALKTLDAWMEKDDRNPELYIDYFNYYLSADAKPSVALDSEPGTKGPSLVISDPETNETIGYIHDTTAYNPESVRQALHYLNQGLRYSGNRLDMYFGKIHVLNDIKDYSTASSTIVEVLSLSRKNDNKWLWTGGKELENGEDFLLGNLNDYYSVWLAAGTEASLDAVKRASEKQMELYPQSTFAYNFLAYYYVLKDDRQTAIPILLRAEAVLPEDVVILNNLANLYKEIGDNPAAISYFRKMIEYGSSQDQEMAKKEIRELEG